VKRFAAQVTLATLLAMTVVSAARAGWVTKEIFWQQTNQGGPYAPTSVWTRDTTYNVVAASQTDTTGAFSLDQMGFPPFYARTSTMANDTTVVGWVLLVPDSLGVTAPTLSSVTAEIDGGIRGMEGSTGLSGWTQVDSSVVTGRATATASAFRIPLKSIGQDAGIVHVANTDAAGYALLAYPDLRLRITSVVGVMSACRAFVRYWKNDVHQN